MADRRFTEVELRRMLEHAESYREDIVEGRWVIDVRRGRVQWEVIVEAERFTESLGCHDGVSGRRAMNSKQPYLEVTYRKGRPLAAYYYLPRRTGDVSVRTQRVEPGLVIDFAKDGRPIGIEITSPRRFSLAAFNRVLKGLGFSTASRSTSAPVRAA